MIEAQYKDKTFNFLANEKNISYVPSENFVFRGTVKENICMSKEYEEKKFQQICSFVNIFSMIQQFENHELIEENGNNLSMGQKQRIAIARAIYGNTSIIVFDEPTANLDQESINSFIEMLQNISKDKICIIVTHDMKLASICNVIYKLSNNNLILFESKNKECYT